MAVQRGKNHAKARPKVPLEKSVELRGWPAIARFLGMPNSTAHRWAKEGMPLRRDGRNVVASPDELNQWLQRTSGEAVGVHVANADADLLKDLKASLATSSLATPSPATRGNSDARPHSQNQRTRGPQAKARKKQAARKPSR